MIDAMFGVVLGTVLGIYAVLGLRGRRVAERVRNRRSRG